MGRKKKVIDLEAVQELASEGNTQEEIAKALDFSRSTFSDRKDVTEAYYKGVAERGCKVWVAESVRFSAT